MIGGLAAGLTLFAWSFIAHLAPIGTAGERALTGRDAVGVSHALQAVMHDCAVYIVLPSAVIAYNPHPPQSAVVWFGIEFLADLAVGLLAAIIAAALSPSLPFWRRAWILCAIGVAATIDIDGGYWNWYGFPTSYLAAQFADHAGGWLAAGVVLARLRR